MKTSPPNIFRAALPHVSLLLTVFFVAAISVRAATPAAGPDEPKTHTLFMGADFSIEQNHEFYRIQDVVGGAFVIKVKGKEVSVLMDQGTVNLKVDSALKLTETSATVAKLKGERAYTPANDPTVNFQRGLADAELQYADASYAQHLTSDIQQNVANKSVPPDSAFRNAFAEAKARQEASAASDVSKANAGPGTTFRDKGSPLGVEGNFDAMDVAFEVSSEKVLTNPYVVIVVKYRETQGKPGQAGNWIYARALPPIGREATKVHVEEGGLPMGFELEDFQVHLYNHGEEIATTVAPKRVVLTRDEAFQYIMIEYVSSHKGATLPASPAMGKLPADLPAKIANGQLKQTYYVKVSKDGKASEAFADESCSQKVEDPYLESVVKNIRFKPALENGKPVEGVAPLKLGQLPI